MDILSMSFSKEKFEKAKKSAQERLGCWIEDCRKDDNSSQTRLNEECHSPLKRIDRSQSLSTTSAINTEPTDSIHDYWDEGKSRGRLSSVQHEQDQPRDSNSSNRSSRLDSPYCTDIQGPEYEVPKIQHVEQSALGKPLISKSKHHRQVSGGKKLQPPVQPHGKSLSKPPPISNCPTKTSTEVHLSCRHLRKSRRHRKKKLPTNAEALGVEGNTDIIVVCPGIDGESGVNMASMSSHGTTVMTLLNTSGGGPVQQVSSTHVDRSKSRQWARSVHSKLHMVTASRSLALPPSSPERRQRVLTRFRRLVKLLIHVRVLLNVSRIRVEEQEKAKTFEAVEEDGSILTFDPTIFKSAMSSYDGLSLRARKVLLKNPRDRDDHDGRIMLEVMLRLPFFEKYSKKVRLDLARLMWYDCFQKGRVIIKQGDPGTRMYLIVSGEVVLTRTVTKDDGTENTYKYRTLRPGATFGELSLIRDLKRDCSAICTMRSECLSLSKMEFNTVLRRHWDIDCNKRLKCLQDCGYFRNWNEVQLQVCADTAELKEYMDNKVILGDISGEPDCVYFIRRGRCEIVRKILVVRHHSPYLRPALLLPECARLNDQFLDKPYGRKLRQEREEDHYLTITTLNAGDYFGAGENLRDTYIIARGKTECVLVNAAQYSIHGKSEELRNLKRQRENILPPNRKLFRRFQQNRKWYEYRKRLVDHVVRGRRVSDRAKSHDVPRSIRQAPTIPASIL